MNFSRQIKIDSKTLDFKFLKVYTTNDYKYYVMVVDCYLNSHLFQMEFKKDRWKIVDVPKEPEWIHRLELQLEAVILEVQMNVGK